MTDIDLTSPESYRQGHPLDQYAWLRRNAPVHWHAEPDGPGFWVLSRYSDIRAVFRDNRLFSSARGIQWWDASEEELRMLAQMMLHMDPPEHGRYRQLVSAGFSPRAADGLRERVEALVPDIVDEVLEDGECDFVTAVSGKLPSYFIAELMGIPRADGVQLYRNAELVHASPDIVSEEERAAAMESTFTYARDVASDKRKNPASDLATGLLQASVDGRSLSDGEFVTLFQLLLNAAGDTVRNGFAVGVAVLLDHPEQWERLRRDPEPLLPAVVDEILRYTSPVVHVRRTATASTSLSGVKIDAGQKVVLLLGSANRDEDVFTDSERFVSDRRPNDHIAFGIGPHFCLGAHLARLEITAMLRAVLRWMPDLALVGPITWNRSPFIIGPSSMPVRFTPGRRTRES